MKSPDKERTAVEHMLHEKRLFDAISRLRTLTPAGSWQIMSEIERAEQDYKLMLQYAFNSNGYDPERANLHADITRRLHSVLLTITRMSQIVDSPSLYFSTLRYEQTRPADTIESLIGEYRHAMSGNSLFERSTGLADGKALSAEERERRERRIFNRVWTTFPLSASDSAAIGSLWNDPAMPERLPLMVIGALLMSSLEFPDYEAIKLLLDAAIIGSSNNIKMRAATAALLLIGTRGNKELPRSVTSRINTLAESTGWEQTVLLVWKQFINAKGTDSIDGKFKKDVLPAMMKLKDQLPDPSTFSDPEAMLEQNPEWEEMFEKSGLSKKLAEMSQLQEQGADLYHSTFAMLKTYTFFNDMANWFMPYDTDHSEVQRITKGRSTSLADMVGMAPFMCDSDKYSLLLSINHVPAQQKEILEGQLNTYSDQMAHMAADTLLPDEKLRENIVNRFMQDLYRFFAHFRRKEEFISPFNMQFDLSRFYSPGKKDTDALRAIADLSFKYGNTDDAFAIYDQLPPDAIILQKRGYILENIGRLKEALAAFEKSELLDGNNIYTLRHIGALHRRLGHPAKAMEYFRRIQQLNPDDLSAVLSEGHCHLDLGSYHDALHCYYRAEFMDEASLKPIRPIAWVTLLTKDFDTSSKYYDRLLRETTPKANDYLNMGHLQLACGNQREALNFYKIYADDKSVDQLREAMQSDSPMLAEAGIDLSIIPLIIDSIQNR